MGHRLHRLLGEGERELEHLGDVGEMWRRCGGDRGETQGRYIGNIWERALEDLMKQDGVVIR